VKVQRGTNEPGATALGDPAKVAQILLNLLSNAIKFTKPDGSVTVNVDTTPDTARISVVDTGSGIPPDKQTSIFEPFVQLGRSFTSAHEGTGLGLSISRDLAHAMEGDLTVSSAEGVGSTFTLTLPRSRESSASA
jgi:signal transduction histidine kinase